MNRIKELRKEKGLTLKQMGQLLNMLDSTLSQYENGRRKPKEEMWQKLADFFDVSVPYLQGKILFVDLSADDYAKKLAKKKWHLGDILEDDKGRNAMIIMNSDRKYVLMNVDSNDKSAFNSGLYYASAYELDFLQDRLREWHKVVED